MKLILVVLSCILGTSYSELKCDKITPGIYSKIICVSKTEFKFSPTEADTLACPNGTVCADVSEICSSTSEPLCSNTNAETTGTCNECLDNTSPVQRVCISDTSYGICNDGILLSLEFTCAAGTPYCRLEADGSVCQADNINLDCPASGSGTGGSTTESSTSGCTTEGFFPDTTDTTCAKYFKCIKDESGVIQKVDLSCLQSGFAFNPNSSRCEPNYTCTN